MTDYISSAIKIYLANYSGVPKTCWQGIFLTLVESLAIGVCFFLSLYFVNTLHVDMTTAGILISCYGVGTSIGGILSGKLCDNMSSQTISIISLVTQALAFFLLAELNSIVLLMINLFVLGVASYGFTTANNVWMLKHCEEHSDIRLKVINISRAALNLGFGLSGFLIGVIAVYGFQPIFYISCVSLFLSAIYLFFQKDRQENIGDNNIQSIAKNCESQNESIIQKENKKVILLILTCLFLIGLIIAQLSITYPIYLQDAFPALGVKAVSILFILDTVLIVLFQAPLVNMLNNYNKILATGIGAFLMGLGMLVLSFSLSFFLAIISCVIWTIGEMIFVAMAQLVCYEKGAQKKKGQSMGIYQAVFACSKIIGPLIGGFIYHTYGGNFLWYLSALIGAVCLIACNHYKKYA